MLFLHRKCNPMDRVCELLEIFILEMIVLVVDPPLKFK